MGYICYKDSIQEYEVFTMADNAEDFRGMQYKEYSKKFTSAQTNTVVEAYPNEAGMRFVIHEIIYSGDAAGTLQILDDTNTAVDGYFWAIGAGGTVTVKGPLKKLPVNRGIRITTTLSGNHSVTIKYSKNYDTVNTN